eukprot:SAG31_NODE_88_length_26714_cov_6.972046_6_plen_43_part_00
MEQEHLETEDGNAIATHIDLCAELGFTSGVSSSSRANRALRP